MLKIQELRIGDTAYKVREPRIRDWIRARSAAPEMFAITMLEGMILDENGVALTPEQVQDLPLQALDELTRVVETMIGTRKDPLGESGASSTG